MSALSDEQAGAFGAIERFIRGSGDERVFTLHGLAGTGKTHVLAAVARASPGATLVAPTGKAASVLRNRTGLSVSTIHSAIYDFRGLTEADERGRRRPIFAEKEETDLRGQLALLDEGSMVGARLATDLLATGVKVVAVGDPGQLQPVADEPFFVQPNRTLTEVHRQALESPIVRQAHNIRAHGTYTSDGDGFRAIRGVISADTHRAADVALCWRNATRRRLNVHRRGLLGHAGPLDAGEPVMCLRNDYRLGIFNGEVYRVARERAPGDDLLIETVSGRVIEALNALIEDVDDDFDARRDDDETTPFALAYAATVHKAQGSEWPCVLLIDEYNRSDGRREYLYTGVTRASERAVVFRSV